jgi:hypothetical protein
LHSQIVFDVGQKARFAINLTINVSVFQILTPGIAHALRFSDFATLS